MNIALVACTIIALAMALRFFVVKLQAQLLIAETEQIINAHRGGS